jgi:hypothetical protein
MKKLLILYPHWHPANLAGVHRPRLTGNFLALFGWTPLVITVDKRFYEETPDNDFEKTFSSDFEVIRVNAFPVTKLRIIGDIGIRAFYQMYREAIRVIREQKPDFLWIPIPSFYTALLGRLLHEKTGIKYGIDYIDPWVRNIKNQNTIRTKLSQLVAKFLEPIAVKKASLISGVSFPYFEPMLQRNFPTKRPVCVAMPYGFDPHDHKIKLPDIVFPWSHQSNKKIWLYAGAFLPNSHLIIEAFFHAIGNLRKNGRWDESIRLWFIGTGQYPAKSVASYAKDYHLEDIVTERRERYPYLNVLNFLDAADTVMIIGSTEKHYTASKTFQALLSKRPVVSAFHTESSAIKVLESCRADTFTVRYFLNMKEYKLISAFEKVLSKRISDIPWNPDLSALDPFSAKESARQLIEAIEYIIN